MFALIQTVDCPGYVGFQIYKRIDDTKWMLVFTTAMYTYIWEKANDYVTPGDVAVFNFTTSFSKGEIYQVLESLKSLDILRVKVITRDEKQILDLLTSDMNEWMSACQYRKVK